MTDSGQTVYSSSRQSDTEPTDGAQITENCIGHIDTEPTGSTF